MIGKQPNNPNGHLSSVLVTPGKDSRKLTAIDRTRVSDEAWLTWLRDSHTGLETRSYGLALGYLIRLKVPSRRCGNLDGGVR